MQRVKDFHRGGWKVLLVDQNPSPVGMVHINICEYMWTSIISFCMIVYYLVHQSVWTIPTGVVVAQEVCNCNTVDANRWIPWCWYVHLGRRWNENWCKKSSPFTNLEWKPVIIGVVAKFIDDSSTWENDPIFPQVSISGGEFQRINWSDQ